MNISPKSQAEVVSQFMSVPPTEIEMGYEKNARYSEAYDRVATAITEDDQVLASSLLEEFAVSNQDILRQDSPFSYLRALRNARSKEQRIFTSKLQLGANKYDLDNNTVQERMENLRDRTIVLASEEARDTEKIRSLFPSGNYFLHATDTDSVVAILETGSIMATVGFADDSMRIQKTNGGSFGVSGNFNSVTNLLGTAGHLAGFIADPETVLKNQGGYFAPPSKSCWSELQYYPDNEDPLHVMQVRDAETHIETAAVAHREGLFLFGILSGNPDVLQQFPAEIAYTVRAQFDQAMQLFHDNPNYLHRAYRVLQNGEFRFTEMLGHDGEDISPFKVLVAAAAEGVFGDKIAQELQQHGLKLDMQLLEIIDPAFHVLAAQTEKLYRTVEGDVGGSSAIQVENTLFYCPAKDYDTWIHALARMPHQPRGIVVYEGKEVRVPAAFALAFPDNGRESLTSQLSVIRSENTIEWLDIFDEPPQSNARASFLILPREANLAGVLALNDDKTIVVKSLDDLDDDND